MAPTPALRGATPAAAKPEKTKPVKLAVEATQANSAASSLYTDVHLPRGGKDEDEVDSLAASIQGMPSPVSKFAVYLCYMPLFSRLENPV